MDDKSKKGKEKDGSASAPPNRRKASFSPTKCVTYKLIVLITAYHLFSSTLYMDTGWAKIYTQGAS
jgi:hypothetical protein